MGLDNTIIHRAEVLSILNRNTLTVINNLTLDMKMPPIVLKQTFKIINDPRSRLSIMGFYVDLA